MAKNKGNKKRGLAKIAAGLAVLAVVVGILVWGTQEGEWFQGKLRVGEKFDRGIVKEKVIQQRDALKLDLQRVKLERSQLRVGEIDLKRVDVPLGGADFFEVNVSLSSPDLNLDNFTLERAIDGAIFQATNIDYDKGIITFDANLQQGTYDLKADLSTEAAMISRDAFVQVDASLNLLYRVR